ncbi:MAG: alpha-glycosidase, partial [Oscillospiraceae bacterium]|nr:alpha-glycosidase [Oscillospiraceae bacterium]
LMTLPGSACIYYGTEIAMPGTHDPDCRRTMPWDEIGDGLHDEMMAQVKALIALRRDYPQTRGTVIRWRHDEENPRLVCFDRPGEGKTLRVWLNGGDQPVRLRCTNVVHARKLENGKLHPGGIVAELV